MTQQIDFTTGSGEVRAQSSIARLRYFFGQLLTQRDLESEQRYHLLLRRLIQRETFGTGTVAGLEVTAEHDSVTPAQSVFVLPGLAIDPDGRELVLESVICLKVAQDPIAPADNPFSAPATKQQLVDQLVARFGGALTVADLDELVSELTVCGLMTEDEKTQYLAGDNPTAIAVVQGLLEQIATTSVPTGSPLEPFLLDRLIGVTYVGIRYGENGAEPSPAVLDASCCGGATCFPSRTQEGVFVVVSDDAFPEIPDPYQDVQACIDSATPPLTGVELCECLLKLWRGLPPDSGDCAQALPIVSLAKVCWSRFGSPGQAQILSVDNCSLRQLAPGGPALRAISGGGGGGGEVNTGANVGTEGVGVFRNKTGVTLNFRKILGTGGITTTFGEGGLIVEIDGSALQETGANVGSGVDVFRDKTGQSLNFKRISGTGNIGVVASGSDSIQVDGSALASAGANVGSGVDAFRDKTGQTLNFKRISGTGNIGVVASGSDSIQVDGSALATAAALAAHVGDTNNPHDTRIANLGTGTLAELNSRLTDAVLDEVGDPRPPIAHGSSHIAGGSDVLDGDRLQVDFVPAAYTRTITPETTALTQLTSHLKGIDDALSSAAAISLQEAYDGGNSVAVTDARGSVAISAGATVTTHALVVNHQNTGSPTAAALRVQSNGSDVLRVGADGQVAFTPPSNKSFSVTAAGTGAIQFSGAAMNITGQFLRDRGIDAQSPATISAPQNDYAPSGFNNADTLRLTLSGNQAITGFVAPASAATRRKTIINVSASASLTLSQDSASSSANNRILCPNNVSVVLLPGEGLVIEYDTTSLRWRIVAVSAQAVIAQNVPASPPSPSAGVFEAKSGATLLFRSIHGVNGLNVVENVDQVDIGAVVGTRDYGNQDLIHARTISFQQELDNGNSGSAKTITWGNAQKQKITLNAAAPTLTFSAPSGPCSGLVLKFVQDATGGRIPNFPASVKWQNGVKPTFTPAANAVDLVSFYFDGTNYYGAFGGNFS